MSDFDLLERGSVVLRWSPSGGLSRYVVLGMIHDRGVTFGRGSRVAEIGENCLVVGSGAHQDSGNLYADGITEDEGFGYVYTFLLGAQYNVPEHVR